MGIGKAGILLLCGLLLRGWTISAFNAPEQRQKQTQEIREVRRYAQKNREISLQLSEIKRRQKRCQETLSALKDTIQSKIEYKNFLKIILSQIGFPYGPQAVAILIAKQTQNVMREIRHVERDIRRNQRETKESEKEKAYLLSEIEKPTPKIQEPAEASLPSRAWNWMFGSTTAKISTSVITDLEALEFATYNQQLLKTHKAMQASSNCKKEIVSHEKEHQQLIKVIQDLSQKIINRLSRSDVFTNQEELNLVMLNMQKLEYAYRNLDAASIRLREIKNKKYALISEVEGIEPSLY